MLRWGILGCGDVAEHKSGPAMRTLPDSCVTAVMRRDADLAREFAERNGVSRWYSDADALIHDANVDIVYISTPPGSHAELAQRVCAAGKAVYIEKPVARNATETAAIVAAFERANVPLFTAYYRRALPRFLTIQQVLTEGRIGTTKAVQVVYSRRRPETRSGLPWRMQAEYSGGGLFLDLACHTLDILDFLFGPLLGASGLATRSHDADYDVEDGVAMTWRWAGGAVGGGVWSFSANVFQDEIRVIGTDGELRFATFGDGPIRWQRDGVAEEQFVVANPRFIQEPLVATIVDEWHKRGRCPSRSDNALRVAQVMDAGLSGFYHGRDDAFWLQSKRWSR